MHQMTMIKVNLSDDENKKVELFKVINELDTKEEAINQMIGLVKIGVKVGK